MDNEKERVEKLIGHELRRDGDISTFAELAVNSRRLEDFIMASEKKFERLEQHIVASDKERLESRQTNWGVLLSGVTVIILVLGLIVYQPLQEVRHLIAEHTKDGHPSTVVEKVNTVDEKVAILRDSLKTEVQINADNRKSRDADLLEEIRKIQETLREHEGKISSNTAKSDWNYIPHTHDDLK